MAPTYSRTAHACVTPGPTRHTLGPPGSRPADWRTVSPLAYAVCLAAAVAGGAVQAALGFGGAVLLVPALAVVAPELLPAASLVAMLPLMAAMAWRGRQHVDAPGAGRLVAGRLPGVVVGTWIVAVFDTRQITVLVAAILLFAVASMARGWTVPLTPRNQALAGVVSGVTGTSTGLGGPPVALLYRGQAAIGMRATLAVALLSGALLSLASLAGTGAIGRRAVEVGALCGVGTLVGLAVAEPVVRRLPEDGVRLGILVWATVGALVAVLRAVTG